MDPLKLMQFNIQSINNKKWLLKTILKDNSIDLCLLNETWLKKSSPSVNITGYNYIGKNAQNEHGGVGILIRNTLQYKTIKTAFYQDIQSIAIVVSTVSGPVSILCVYCPPYCFWL